MHEFKYTGRRQIAGSNSNKGGAKSMTLPARMQPPDFTVDPPSNHLPLSGSNSIGRGETQPSRGILYIFRIYLYGSYLLFLFKICGS